MFTCLLNAEHDNDGQILLVCTSVVMYEEQQSCTLDAATFLRAPNCVWLVLMVFVCLKKTSCKIKFNEMCIICLICYTDIWHYAEKLLAWHCSTRVVVYLMYLVHPDLPDPHMQIVHISLHILHITGVQQVPCIVTWITFWTKQRLMNNPFVSPHNFQSTWGIYHRNEWPVCKIWSSDHAVDESNLLRSSSVMSRKWLPTIWRNTLPTIFTAWWFNSFCFQQRRN